MMHFGEASLHQVTSKVSRLSPTLNSADLEKQLKYHENWLKRDSNGLTPTSDISDVVGSDYLCPHQFFPGKFHRNGKFEASPYFDQSFAQAVMDGETQFIAERGRSVDVNAWDLNGQTCLFRAAEKGNIHVCAALVLAAADPNCRALDGRRAIDHVPKRHTALTTLLRACAGDDILNEHVLEAVVAVPE